MQIKGRKFLLDMLAMAQGTEPGAGNTIQVIRSNQDPRASETITIGIEDLFENGKTELNVPIFAGDVINVLRAGSVFVVGEVTRPNEFVLRNGKNITVAQAVALANGFTKEAKKGDCNDRDLVSLGGCVEQRGILLVCIGAIFTILVHSLTDFNLQIPSNAMLFFTFIGISLALPLPEKEQATDSTD